MMWLCSLAMNDENKVAVAAKGGIEAVVEGMGALLSSESFQKHGCMVLGNLAGNDANKVAVAGKGKGAIEVVVAMRVALVERGGPEGGVQGALQPLGEWREQRGGGGAGGHRLMGAGEGVQKEGCWAR
jgi:hypothetical protein